MSKSGVIKNKDGVSTNGNKGGVFVGERHSMGGIGVEVEGGGKVEVETDEILLVPEVSTNNRVSTFNGKQMTHKEIASELNQAYGGVPIKKRGGYLDEAKQKISQLKQKREEDVRVKPSSIVITRGVYLDDKTKHDFNGQMLTNKEILSKINAENGGASFADGGKIGTVNVSGKKYSYKGKETLDSEIVEGCGCKHQMASGGSISDKNIVDYLAKNINGKVFKRNVIISTKEYPKLQERMGYGFGWKGDLIKTENNLIGIKIGESSKVITLYRIVVENKGDGIGSKIIYALIKYAKDNNKIIALDDVSNKNYFKKFGDLEFYSQEGAKKSFILVPNQMANGGKINEKNKAVGDCYKVAGQFLIDNFYSSETKFIGTPKLVHAEVVNQGKIKGVKYGHAWVEDDVLVYDFANNKKIVLPISIYYRIGKVNTKDPKKYRTYTAEEATKKMHETKHYGSWDIDTKL